jgi:hypothetical protein
LRRSLRVALLGFERLTNQQGVDLESERLKSLILGPLHCDRHAPQPTHPGHGRACVPETLPGGKKPLQLLTRGEDIRSVHGTAYTRLHNADLVGMLKEYATDFTPPHAGFNGATGLYCGEQNLGSSRFLVGNFRPFAH